MPVTCPGESLAKRTPSVKGTPSLKSGRPGVTESWYSEQGQTPSGRGDGTVVNVHVPPALSSWPVVEVAVRVAV